MPVCGVACFGSLCRCCVRASLCAPTSRQLTCFARAARRAPRLAVGAQDSRDRGAQLAGHGPQVGADGRFCRSAVWRATSAQDADCTQDAQPRMERRLSHRGGRRRASAGRSARAQGLGLRSGLGQRRGECCCAIVSSPHTVATPPRRCAFHLVFALPPLHCVALLLCAVHSPIFRCVLH